MRCRNDIAMVVPRPRRPLRTRSRICAVSISKDSRVPAADIEDTVITWLKEHLAARKDTLTTSAVRLGNRGDLEQLVAGIVVHKDRLIVRLKSENMDEASDCPDDPSLTIPC